MPAELSMAERAFESSGGGRVLAKSIDNRTGLGLDEQHTLGVAVDVDSSVIATVQAASSGIERDISLASALLEKKSHVGDPSAVWPVEVDAS